MVVSLKQSFQSRLLFRCLKRWLARWPGRKILLWERLAHQPLGCCYDQPSQHCGEELDSIGPTQVEKLTIPSLARSNTCTVIRVNTNRLLQKIVEVLRHISLGRVWHVKPSKVVCPNVCCKVCLCYHLVRKLPLVCHLHHRTKERNFHTKVL